MKFVLTNWKEFRFKKQPFFESVETWYTTTFVEGGWYTNHTTIKAVKAAIRRENSVKGDPSFRWQRVDKNGDKE